MRLDLRDLDDGSLVEADLCIVGGGAAGITLALGLAGSGLKVVLLESGGLVPEDATSALSEGTVTGLQTWTTARSRVRVLGGSTQHWGGYCQPLGAEDFVAKAWQPGSGWPITRADLDPYYALAQETLELGTFDYDPAARAEKAGFPLFDFSLGAESRYYQLSPPTRMGERYLPALDASIDLTVYTHANATNLVLDQAHARLIAVEAQSLSGQRMRVEASRFVLALGGLENVRLLLSSNTQVATGVANGSDAVGRYFMEHPHFYRLLTTVHGALPNVRFYTRHASDLRAADGRAVDILGTISLSPSLLTEQRLLSMSATWGSTAFDEAMTGPISLGLSQALVTRDGATPGAQTLTLRCEQSPWADSRVTLDNALDPLGMPRLRVHHTLAPGDQARLAQGVQLIARELGALGLARVWTPSLDDLRWQPKGGSHHMGTTRMGTDPASSVVDANCRSHEVENLFIAGSSVFPTGGSANPTLTIVALAHRLAQHLEATR